MQLQFEQLDFQTQAIAAIVDLFRGEQHHGSEFGLHNPFSPEIANRLLLSHTEIERNLHEIQQQNALVQTAIGDFGLNFNVEMETGTGKTYVYLRTILELNRAYGWRKFVIVVPSVAIREGVNQTLRATKAHFDNLFDKPIVHHQTYRSDKLNALKQFAQSLNIEILLMNIDAFNKKDNLINRANENGEAPITHLASTRPIVIIDEPQNMASDLAQQAIDSLNPLFVLRYSATHKQPFHKVFSLNPIAAYNQKLVKQIEVHSVVARHDANGAYVLLKGFDPKKTKLTANVELHCVDKLETKKKAVKVSAGDDLFVKSGGNEMYRQGFVVNALSREHGTMTLSNGQTITLGEQDDAVRDEIMKTQMRETIKEHLRKERKLNPQGIKVLSLFFIDKVANYRNDGKFARWFKEIYEQETGKSADGIHDGYFSADKDTKGNSEADEKTYDLIMKDKEKLLSLDTPLRFIFSHSALKEGWDNPNVFQICTFNETQSPIKKRQEIGRGLRLAVNQKGERVRDEGVNILTVIPNESYEAFAANLQKEYEDEYNIQFANGGAKKKEQRQQQTYRKGFTLDPNFVAIWQKLCHKTRYSVQFEREKLIAEAVKRIQQMPEIPKTGIVVQKADLAQSITYGVEASERDSKQHHIQLDWAIPDVLSAIQKKTQLTRQTIFEIVQQSGRVNEIAHNPQYFIDLMSETIKQALHALMIDGIEYARLPDNDTHYTQSLAKWQNLEQFGSEFFRNQHTFSVQNPNKTIFADYINLDSDTEHTFAQNCENYDDVLLYFKLPNWFKIPTPIGNYNPDWAIVMRNREHVYFVAETKNTGKSTQDGVVLAKLSEAEQQKIACAKKHFSVFDGVKYQVVETLSELN
ncbi:MAG: DEAD/DEAH box helicase family protein [Neisseria sp.]|nr:DEAD/DEAH box helicase family protein [Neisseria sp.]